MTTPAYLRGGGRGRGQRTSEEAKGKPPPGFRSLAPPKAKSSPAPPEQTTPPEEEPRDASSVLLSKIIKQYTDETASSDLGMTNDYLSRMITDHAASCPICLEDMGKTDPIWSCRGCFSAYHLPCIQKWVRGLLALKVYQQPDGGTDGGSSGAPSAPQLWSCPSCRREYSCANEWPSRYQCFCGKVDDPPFDPWLLPHSCGELCRRSLVDAADPSATCAHVCLLLCHPGPCPPCPQMLQARCHCGRAGPVPRRCAQRAWSCGAPCASVLQCGTHQCAEVCHAGPCPPCRRTSLQACVCGAERRLQSCQELVWQCTKICGRPLACGAHFCQRVCHLGDCGLCPNFSAGGLRSCPCGKTKYEGLSCTEETAPCGDTCDRVLACGLHRCERPCHTGDCGACKQQVERSCRCGARTNRAVCSQDSVLCSQRCPRYRNCGRHACKRRCCDGECQPCEHPCGRTLNCRNHKCPNRCHAGPCYLCTQVEVVKCACGGTQLRLPCGAKRDRKEIVVRCELPCPRSSTNRACGHAFPSHLCHRGECPPCRQVCKRSLAGCSHRCPRPCHQAVLVKPRVRNEERPVGPWDPNFGRGPELKALPCPPCREPLQVRCRGDHTDLTLECSDWSGRPEARTCGRPCGRPLACGNHLCERECHVLSGTESSCDTCNLDCREPRPDGCTHRCALGACHSGPCPACPVLLRLRCHCSALAMFIACGEWRAFDAAARSLRLTCPGQCPRPLACGHLCGASCHSGPCTAAAGPCAAKVQLRCRCGREKRKVRCSERPVGEERLPCSDKCRERKEEERAKREEMEAEENRAQSEPIGDVPTRRKRNRKKEANAEDSRRRPPLMTSLRRFLPAILMVGVAALLAWAVFEARAL